MAAVKDAETEETTINLGHCRPPARVALSLWLALLAACSSLPTIVPDMARRPAIPVQLDGTHGPLSADRSKAILDRLKASGEQTNIFDLHLAVEEAIVGS